MTDRSERAGKLLNRREFMTRAAIAVGATAEVAVFTIREERRLQIPCGLHLSPKAGLPAAVLAQQVGQLPAQIAGTARYESTRKNIRGQ